MIVWENPGAMFVDVCPGCLTSARQFGIILEQCFWMRNTCTGSFGIVDVCGCFSTGKHGMLKVLLLGCTGKSWERMGKHGILQDVSGCFKVFLQIKFATRRLALTSWPRWRRHEECRA